MHTFGQFTDKILGYANETFSTLHHKFLKQIWADNNTVKKLHSNQCITDWQNARYEIYIPTRDNTEYNLSYSRIAIQIQELNSNDTKHQDAYKLMNHIIEPLGAVESELLILIAPHQDRWGLVRGFKHRNKPGYFTAVFTNTSPEVIWKRVIDHIHNFTQKRLDGLMNALNLPQWMWKYAVNKEDNLLYYSVLKNYCFAIRQSCFTFLRLIRHFRGLMASKLAEIGESNVALMVLEPLRALSLESLQRVFVKVREGLQIKISRDDEGLHLLRDLEAYAVG